MGLSSQLVDHPSSTAFLRHTSPFIHCHYCCFDATRASMDARFHVYHISRKRVVVLIMCSVWPPPVSIRNTKIDNPANNSAAVFQIFLQEANVWAGALSCF